MYNRAYAKRGGNVPAGLSGLYVEPLTNAFPACPESSKDATNFSKTSAVSLASA